MEALSFSIYIAVKEIWRNRGRFFLLSMVIALITLLVLFIAALGEGLANGNRQYLANLDAQLIVFREKSDYIIPSSRLDAVTLRAVRRVDGVDDAGALYTSTAQVVSTTEPIKVSLLGVVPDDPGMPEIVEGREFRGGDSNETVVDRNFALRSGTRTRRDDRAAVNPGGRRLVLQTGCRGHHGWPVISLPALSIRDAVHLGEDPSTVRGGPKG